MYIYKLVFHKYTLPKREINCSLLTKVFPRRPPNPIYFSYTLYCINTIMTYIICCINKTHILSVLSFLCLPLFGIAYPLKIDYNYTNNIEVNHKNVSRETSPIIYLPFRKSLPYESAARVYTPLVFKYLFSSSLASINAFSKSIL